MINARILRTEETPDVRKNIRIIVEFSEDDKIIVPEWPLYAQWSNFIGRTAVEISEWIRVNVEHQIGNIIMERTKSDLNTEFMQAIEQLKTEKIFQKDEIIIPVAPSLTIAEAFNVTLKSDGTYTTDRIK